LDRELRPSKWQVRNDRERIMKHFLSFCLALACLKSNGQGPAVRIPEHGDRYSELVRTLESGQLDIDYTEFRESLIESPQFLLASKLDSLKKEMYEHMRKSRFDDVIRVAKEILSRDYTDMLAHKILQQTYKQTGDTLAQRKYHDIEFGLLHSILKSGDGKTCKTAWHVVQLDEEYFILDMQGAFLLKQTLDNGCDEMKVKTDEGKKTYYFEVTKIFEGYNKRLKRNP
jgi:hypothetical protein